MLIAAKDTTGLAFADAWNASLFAQVHINEKVRMSSFDTASHSFADMSSRNWLYEHVAGCLAQQSSLD
ncbi:MAG: hypothetical protein IBJ12_12755 [Sphingomonadaceae bacterium]|nr:hypothetical protein [Sphingomonadaceae bacterium]